MRRKIAMIREDILSLEGGSEDRGVKDTYIDRVAEHLAGMGYQVDVFNLRNYQALPEIYEQGKSIRVIHVPAVSFEAEKDLPGRMRDFAKYMVEFFDQQIKPYDLLHVDSWTSGLLAAEIKAALGTPFVVTLHTLGKAQREPQGNAELSEERLEVEERIIREADGMITESLQDREDLIRLYDANPAHITQIPPEFDGESWAPGDTPAWSQLALPTDAGVMTEIEPLTASTPVDTLVKNKRISVWQTVSDKLTVFYENILAVRRISVFGNAIGQLAEDQHTRQLEMVEQAFEAAIQTFEKSKATLNELLLDAANLIAACLDGGGRIIVCGDGDSAIDAQRFTIDLMRHFIGVGNTGVPVLLLKQPGVLSAWSEKMTPGNDFSQQLERSARPGDLLIGITTDANSPDLIDAFRCAQENHVNCLSVQSSETRGLSPLSDVALVIPSSNPEHVREVQILILHLLSDLVGEQIQMNQQMPNWHLLDATHSLNIWE